MAAGGELWDELCDAAGVVAIDWFGGDGFAAAGACSCAFETKQKPADRMMMIAVLSKRIFLPKAAQDTATGAAVAKDAIRHANHPEHRRAVRSTVGREDWRDHTAVERIECGTRTLQGSAYRFNPAVKFVINVTG